MERAAERITAKDLEALKQFNAHLQAIADELMSSKDQRWTTSQCDSWVTTDVQFHLVILRTSGNRRALKAIHDLRIMSHIFGKRWSDRTVEDLSSIIAVHNQLIDAIGRRDVTLARQLVREHIRRGCRIALDAHAKYMMQQAAGMPLTIDYPDSLKSQIERL